MNALLDDSHEETKTMRDANTQTWGPFDYSELLHREEPYDLIKLTGMKIKRVENKDPMSYIDITADDVAVEPVKDAEEMRRTITGIDNTRVFGGWLEEPAEGTPAYPTHHGHDLWVRRKMEECDITEPRPLYRLTSRERHPDFIEENAFERGKWMTYQTIDRDATESAQRMRLEQRTQELTNASMRRADGKLSGKFFLQRDMAYQDKADRHRHGYYSSSPRNHAYTSSSSSWDSTSQYASSSSSSSSPSSSWPPSSSAESPDFPDHGVDGVLAAEVVY